MTKKQIEKTVKLIDASGLGLILEYTKKKPGNDHFHVTKKTPMRVYLAISRLLDLGILWFAINKGGKEWAYHWTPLGRAVADYIKNYK